MAVILRRAAVLVGMAVEAIDIVFRRHQAVSSSYRTGDAVSCSARVFRRQSADAASMAILLNIEGKYNKEQHILWNSYRLILRKYF